MQTSNSSWKKLNMDTVAEAKDIKYPPPLTSIIRWAVESDTSQLVSYYILKRDNMDEIVEWANSAPIFTNRLSFEIRQLTEDLIFDNAEAFVVEEVVSAKEKLMQEGKLRKDADGTYWIKIEIEDEALAEKVADAEKHSEILNPKA